MIRQLVVLLLTVPRVVGSMQRRDARRRGGQPDPQAGPDAVSVIEGHNGLIGNDSYETGCQLRQEVITVAE
jgi:hypothetical protein